MGSGDSPTNTPPPHFLTFPIQAKTALADIVDSAIPDGIDIHFLNEHGRIATGVKVSLPQLTC